MSPWGNPGSNADEGVPPCAASDCGRDAAFYLFNRDDDRWRPLCERHVLAVHPSIEVKAWMESGYLRPVERGPPEGPPDEPRFDRRAAFRAEVDETMGWTE